MAQASAIRSAWSGFSARITQTRPEAAIFPRTSIFAIGMAFGRQFPSGFARLLGEYRGSGCPAASDGLKNSLFYFLQFAAIRNFYVVCLHIYAISNPHRRLD